MEYIEQPPKVENKKRKKIIYSIVISALAIILAGMITGVYFLCANVFIEYNNVEYLQYQYEYGEDQETATGVTITSVLNPEDETVDLPALPTSFRIPNRLSGLPVTAIGASAFAGLTTIEEVIIPDTVTSIGSQAFSNCTNLTRFNVPSALTDIGANAFYGTAWLNNQPNNSPVEIGEFLYSYKGELAYPSAIVGSEETYNELISSGEYQAENIYKLYDVNRMSDGVFADQTGITYVEIPSKFSSINSSLFSGCTRLETLVMLEGVTSVGESAFANCSALTSVTIPESLQTVGASAFSGCTSLASIDLTTGSISSLGEGVFQNCSSLTSITIPENITTISANLFNGCSSLATVNFENDEYDPLTSKINYIRSSAFRGTALTEFTVPFKVSIIYGSAFNACPNLETIYFYEGQINETNASANYGLTNIYVSAFSSCSSLHEVVLVDSTNSPVSNRNEVSFPITLTSLGSTSGSSGVFDNTAIEIVNFSRNITAIPAYFASGTTSLRAVNFDSENTSLVTIGSNAFSSTSIEAIAIPNTVREIGVGAFANCALLATASLPVNNYFVSVPGNAFYGCVSLASIEIPANVTAIDASAFSGCTSLGEVTFAEGSNLSNISTSVFMNCSSLTSIILPSNVVSIAANLFNGASALQEVIITRSVVVPLSNVNAFFNIDALTYDEATNTFSSDTFRIIVPEALYESYQSATSWAPLVNCIYTELLTA